MFGWRMVKLSEWFQPSGHKRCDECNNTATQLGHQLKYCTSESYQQRKNHHIIAPEITKLLIQKLQRQIKELTEKLAAAEDPGPAAYNFSRVTLPDVEQSQLVKMVTSAINKQLLTPDMFLYKLIYQQFVVLEPTSTHGVRWDPAVVSWFQSLKYAGGKRVIDIMRGNTGNVRRGNSKHDPHTICLEAPSNATLKRHRHRISIGPYDELPDYNLVVENPRRQHCFLRFQFKASDSRSYW
eukprot:TRINITY_DN1684_c0_g1_i1.p1 TRINITY_DN1684_c0_g1~~TRINITY_DN1684_c0_g1_i1.p1  ORF type:complete len:239 (+),score=32.16 TRINITY_DN1684_c0_g1_i1:537-1253(+)